MLPNLTRFIGFWKLLYLAIEHTCLWWHLKQAIGGYPAAVASHWWLSSSSGNPRASHWWLSSSSGNPQATHWWLSSSSGNPRASHWCSSGNPRASHWWLSSSSGNPQASHWWLSSSSGNPQASHWWLSSSSGNPRASHWWLSGNPQSSQLWHAACTCGGDTQAPCEATAQGMCGQPRHMVAGLTRDGCHQQLTQWLHLCAVAKKHKTS